MLTPIEPMQDWIPDDWTEPVNDVIHVPDHLDKIFNKVGIQVRFHTISGKNEIQTIAHIVHGCEKFFIANALAQFKTQLKIAILKEIETAGLKAPYNQVGYGLGLTTALELIETITPNRP